MMAECDDEDCDDAEDGAEDNADNRVIQSYHYSTIILPLLCSLFASLFFNGDQ